MNDTKKRARMFMGRHDTPDFIYPLILESVQRLAAEKHVDTFYMGNNGRFDAMAARAVTQLRAGNSAIYGFVVLAYPDSRNMIEYPLPTILPNDIELVPPRFAIEFRNKWMINNAHYVIAYAPQNFGNAAKYVHMAERQGREIIRLDEPAKNS